MKRLFRTTASAVFVIGCSSPQVDIAGQWILSEVFTSSGGASCTSTGDFLLDQFDQGARFSGQRARTVVCTPDPGVNLSGNQGITNGEVNGSRLAFEIDFCEYQGTVAGDDMNGSFTCPELGTPPLSFSGTWSATR